MTWLTPAYAAQFQREWKRGAKERKENAEELLPTLTRRELRDDLRCLRYELLHPSEPNPRAAQLEVSGVTLRRIYAEYRRRGWKIPKRTRAETRF
jgi:hypothetical protein